MALTKVSLIQDGVIVVGHLHTNHGITTDHIGEGSNKYYSDTLVQNFLTTNNYVTSSSLASTLSTGAYFTGVSHDTEQTELTFTKSDGTTDIVDLTQYIDDTNLARLTSGTIDAATGIATFTRDDATTFTVDFSSLLDDTDDYVNSATFNASNGVLTLGRLGGGSVTVDLDGRYLESSFTETDPTVPSHVKSISTTDISNWNTAYGWGDHAGLYAPASHSHDYVSEGGTSFNGEYPMVVRVGSNNYYSNPNITFRGSDSKLSVGGYVQSPLFSTTGTHGGNFGHVSFSWGGSTGYPTLYSTHSDRWVMHVKPHIVWTQNGERGYTGGTEGSMIRFEGNLGSTISWDAGCLTDISSGGDHWGVTRDGTWAFYADPSANLHANASMRAPIFYDLNDTNYYVNPNDTSRFNKVMTNNSGATPRYDTAFYVLQAQHWYGDTGSQTMYIGESGNPLRLRGTLRVGSNANADSGMKLTVAGSANATSDFRAPIFYDSNNTGYYFHGDATTNLNALTVNGTFTVVNGVINMNNNDGFVYDDGANVMKVKYDGTEYPIWTSANDGSGSGLDADLLDGSQGSYYDHRRYTRTDNYLGGYYVSGGTEKPNSSVFGAGKFKVAMLRGGSNNLGFGGTWNDVMWLSTYNGGDVKRSLAIVSSKYDNTSVWIAKQSYDATDWGTGYLIWNSGNDGSGSGLDADLLDGQHASSFAPAGGSAGTDWYCDDLFYDQWIRNNGTGDSGLYWHNSGHAGYGWHIYPQSRADMTFRTGLGNGGIKGTVQDSTARGYVHWTTSNEIGFLNASRSWSLRVDNSGNTFATASHRAPIFYDSNDTYYYVNPASDSRQNNISANRIGINNSSNSSRYGISLYGGYNSGEPTYGLLFTGTSLGTHGSVTGNWATYFTMNDDSSRGWIFRRVGSGNAASISAGGHATFDGSVKTPFIDVDKTSTYGTGIDVTYSGSVSTGMVIRNNTSNSDRSGIEFYYSSAPQGPRGWIAIGASSVSYNTGSDYRLKENLTPITDGIERVKLLQPKRFNFISEPDKVVDGFVAHETQEVVPEAVTGTKDAVDEEGNPEYQGIDQGKLVPLLTAALQEAIAKIEDLEARIQTLEGQ